MKQYVVEVKDGQTLEVSRRKHTKSSLYLSVNQDTVVELVVAPPPPPPPPVSKILFSSAMTEGQEPHDVWQSTNPPSVDGVRLEDRIRAVSEADTPGTGDPRKPKGPTMRVELRPGDVQTSGDGYTASRAECYDRHAVPGSLPASEWPDPPGSIRFYGMSVYIPLDWALSDGWRVITQWKGYRSGSPPLALELTKWGFELGSNVGVRRPLPGFVRGAWHNVVFKILHSPDPAVGRLSVWVNNVNVLGEHARATMAIVGGSADPGYLKQGLYRTSASLDTDVLHFGPLVVATTIEAVGGYLK